MINRSDPLAEVGEISRSTRQIGSRIMLFNVLALLVFAVLIGKALVPTDREQRGVH
jgi:hypothetical protein